MKFQVNQAKYANETSVAPVNKRKSVCLEDESIEDPLFAAQVSDYYYILVSWGWLNCCKIWSEIFVKFVWNDEENLWKIDKIPYLKLK